MAEFIIGSPLRQLARRHRPLRRLLWWLDYAMVWLMVSLFRLLPIDTASRLGARVGRFIGPKMKNKHRIYTQNMHVAFPGLAADQLDALVRRAWGEAGRILAEYPHLDTLLRDEERLQIDIRQPLAALQDQQRPCVVVTAHQSNWELVCTAMAKLGIPNASLYTPPSNPWLDRMLLDSRQALNCKLLPRDNAARHLVRAMKQGRTAGMVTDRRIDEGRPIEYFGRDKLTTLLPAKLAMKFDCDIVPVQVTRLRDARYRVTFHPPLRPLPDAGDEETAAIELVQRYHRQFEAWVLEQPEAWFCSKRLWPKGKIDNQRSDGSEAGAGTYAN